MISGNMWPANSAMMARLQTAADNDAALSGADLQFYQHELYENSLMNAGMRAEEAHLQTLRDVGQTQSGNHDPSVMREYPGFFNRGDWEYWNIKP